MLSVNAPRNSAPANEARSDQLERLRRLQGRRAEPAQTSERVGRVIGEPLALHGADAARPPRTKRHHAARGARAGALAISCVTTVGLATLFARIDARSANSALAALPATIAVAPSTTSEATPTSATATSVTTSLTAAAAAAPTTVATVPPTAAVAAFNGDVVNTQYGPVEVQVQLSGGAIADVAIGSYPNGDGRSQRISAVALPILRSETLTAQSAQIDTVSGATYTSGAYIRSLQSAIDAAHLAGATALA
jgi:uncharacterized protein with FMN-binding domain